MALHRFEVLPGIKRGRTFDEYVERIGGDDVELFGGRHQVMAGVIEGDARLRVQGDAVVLLAEEPGRGRGNDRLYFANADLFDIRVTGECASRYARAEADSEHGFRVRMKETGQVAHHALQLHVEDLRGGFDVAIYVDINGSVVPARNRNGGVAALFYVKDFRLSFVDSHLTSVGDEIAGSRRDTEPTQTSQNACNRDAGSCGRRLNRYEQRDETAGDGRDQEVLLRLLRSDGRNQAQTHNKRADNTAQRVSGIDRARCASGVSFTFGQRRAGERKACAPEERAREDG